MKLRVEDETIELRATPLDELPEIVAMEVSDGGGFVIPYSLERHQQELARSGVLYRSVYRGDELIGFVILALESDGLSVEFRRIVIRERGKGYGTIALSLVDDHSRNQLGRTRVWLDVFETNDRARHLYEKSGYRAFGRSEHDGRPLILYEKWL